MITGRVRRWLCGVVVEDMVNVWEVLGSSGWVQPSSSASGVEVKGIPVSGRAPRSFDFHQFLHQVIMAHCFSRFSKQARGQTGGS